MSMMDDDAERLIDKLVTRANAQVVAKKLSRCMYCRGTGRIGERTSDCQTCPACKGAGVP